MLHDALSPYWKPPRMTIRRGGAGTSANSWTCTVTRTSTFGSLGTKLPKFRGNTIFWKPAPPIGTPTGTVPSPKKQLVGGEAITPGFVQPFGAQGSVPTNGVATGGHAVSGTVAFAKTASALTNERPSQGSGLPLDVAAQSTPRYSRYISMNGPQPVWGPGPYRMSNVKSSPINTFGGVGSTIVIVCAAAGRAARSRAPRTTMAAREQRSMSGRCMGDLAVPSRERG